MRSTLACLSLTLKPTLTSFLTLSLTLSLTRSTRRGQDAPYLLEPLATGFGDEEVAVRLALLTAALKLFFARPPECQALLGAALAAAAADANQDVRDRGLMYYRRAPGLCAGFLVAARKLVMVMELADELMDHG